MMPTDDDRFIPPMPVDGEIEERDLDESIHAFADGREPLHSVTPGYARWSIPTEDGEALAEWAFRHLVAGRRERDQAKALAAEWRRQVDEWETKNVRGPNRTIAFFEHHLFDWGRRRRDATGRAVFNLLSGAVRTTQRKPIPALRDAAAFIAWAGDDVKRYDACVRPTALISGLDTHGKVIEIPDVILLTCGCHVRVDEQLPPIEAGQAWPCPNHERDELIGKIEGTTPVVVDLEGNRVPGVYAKVSDLSVTAS